MTENGHGWTYGYCLLFGLYALAAIFAIGHIEEKTSYGLKDVLEIIKALLIFWAGWKFGNRSNKDVTQ